MAAQIIALVVLAMLAAAGALIETKHFNFASVEMCTVITLFSGVMTVIPFQESADLQRDRRRILAQSLGDSSEVISPDQSMFNENAV